MSLKGRYHNVLFTDFLLKELKLGTVPNIDELEEQVKELEASNPLLGERPLIALEGFDIAHYESASASKWNTTLTSQKRDITAMYDTIKDLSVATIKQERRWASYYESVRRSLITLEDRIQNLLLLKRDTLGYFAYVSDDFVNMEKINQALTTARIDTNAGIATMREEWVPSGVARILPDDSWIPSTQLLSVTNLVLQETPAGMGVSHTIDDEYSKWLSVIRTSTAQVITHSLLVDMGESKAVSKATFVPFGSTGTSAFVVSLMYSQNGVDFVLVPGQASISLVGSPGVWMFPEIQARFFKFIISKSGYDLVDIDNNFVYEFGCKNVSFYRPNFDTVVGTLLESNALSVVDNDGVAKTFSKVALNTCDFKPEGTDIYYLISPDGVTFIPISSLDDSAPSHPQIIDFTNAVPVNNVGSTSVFDVTKDAEALDSLASHGITLNGVSDVGLNSYVPLASVGDINETSYVVYRNLGKQGQVVRGISSGWSLNIETNTYQTILRVDDPSGYEINLGSTSAKIDGVSRTGTVLLSKGDYLFETDAENWVSLDTTSPVLTEVLLEAADSLYPYNHKYIVEGYPYPTGFTGDKIYTGGVFWAEMKIGFISMQEFDSLSDTGELGVYTRRVDATGNIAFIFKTQQSFGDHFSERFRVEYKLPTRTFTTIILRAILSTSDPSVSPFIDSYTIKLG